MIENNKSASVRLHPVWGQSSDDPVVTIAEVLPLLPSRTIGNVGVSTGARQPSLRNNFSQYGAYCGVIHEQGTKPYKYNHMQEEMLHKASPQVDGVFEFVCHKQSLDKEVFHKPLFC